MMDLKIIVKIYVKNMLIKMNVFDILNDLMQVYLHQQLLQLPLRKPEIRPG